MAEQVRACIGVPRYDRLGGRNAAGGLRVILERVGWTMLGSIERQGSEAVDLYVRFDLPGGAEAHGGRLVVWKGLLEAVEGWKEEIGLDDVVEVDLY